jgi:ubiquitin-protein ligase
MPGNTFVSKETISRLTKDIVHITKHPLEDHGIYYCHDEADMMKGYAMIVGPNDTPYFGGYYLFEFAFPYDYPYSPPKLTYLTNDGNVRFNPNLYTNGKVCISILNTWHGEQWSSCQTISSILLTLCTVLNKTPLINEPGIVRSHPEIPKYNACIEFSNISVAICDAINKTRVYSCSEMFYPVMKRLFLQNYDFILSFIEGRIKEDPIVSGQIITIGFYNMRVAIDYKLLRDKWIQCKQLLENVGENERISAEV